MQTRAYSLFVSGKHAEITKSDFYEFVRVNEYFKPKARQRRFSLIDNVVLDSKDLVDVWTYLKAHFEEEMS